MKTTFKLDAKDPWETVESVLEVLKNAIRKSKGKSVWVSITDEMSSVGAERKISEMDERADILCGLMDTKAKKLMLEIERMKKGT